MSVETDKLPPVPSHTKPINEQGGMVGYFETNWSRWFIQAREKINVINDRLANLSSIVNTGIAVLAANGEWQARTITGTPNRISVSNGDGVAGNPTIDIHTSYVGQSSITTLGTITTGVWEGTDVGVVHGGTGASTASAARDNLGAAAKMTTTVTSATGGSATALPAQPVGYVEVDIGGATKKIPYYD